MKSRFFSGCALSVMACLPQMAFAQEVAEGGPAGLDEIVVTAQRKVESAQKAAIPISVVTTESLDRAGVTEASGLNSVAPALTVSNGGGANTSFFIRGVGNFTNTAYNDPAVAFNLDGVYINRTTATGGTFFDLERIEVLKGPQGTLYGRNATGGAVNVIPARPQLGETGGSLSVGYGNYDSFDAEGHVNIALGDQAALRVAGKLIRADGSNQDGTSDNKANAFRVQLLTEPSETFSVRLSADYARAYGVGSGSTLGGAMHFAPGAPASATAPANYVFEPSNLDPRAGMFTPEAQAFFGRQVIGGSFITPAPMSYPRRDNDNWGVLAEINLGSGIGDFTLLSSYRESNRDDLFNGPAFRAALARDKSDQFSVELRLAGHRIGPVEWLIGGYYFNEGAKGRGSYNQYLVNSIQQYDLGTRSLAGFGRLTFHLSDALRFVAAGRYTDDRKTADASADTLLNICTNAPPPAGPGCFGGPSIPVALTRDEIAAAIPPALLPFGFPPAPGPANARPFGSAGNILFYSPFTIDRALKKKRFTYRLAAEADLGPSSLAYVSYETGYRSGGFSLAPGKETFEPEYIKAITVGVKNRFFDNRLQLNLEGFYWRYSGQQIAHFGLDGLGLSNYFVDNSGRSTIKGVDLDLQFKAARNTVLTTSVQYLDSKLDEFVYESPRDATSLPPAVTCAYAPSQDNLGRDVYSVDCAGKPGLYSPKWSINAGIVQDVDIGDYRITFTADGRYRSNAATGFEYLPQQNSGSSFTADLTLAFGPQDDRWKITGWVRNIGNRDVLVQSTYNGTIGGTLINLYAPPRTYGVRASVNF